MLSPCAWVSAAKVYCLLERDKRDLSRPGTGRKKLSRIERDCLKSLGLKTGDESSQSRVNGNQVLKELDLALTAVTAWCGAREAGGVSKRVFKQHPEDEMQKGKLRAAAGNCGGLTEDHDN